MSLPEERAAAARARVVSAPGLPPVPHSWYYVGSVKALRAPTEITLGTRVYVAFIPEGRAHVLDGRCPHFAARLARGTLSDGCLHCPMHGGRCRPDGTCDGMPSGDEPPPTVRLAWYPTTVKGRHVFFHTSSCNATPMPFFHDVAAEELLPAPPFSFNVEMPWWLVSANGFDGQHFLAAHDRRLVGAPQLMRWDAEFETRATFVVVGTEWRDRVARRLADSRVEMTVRSAGGSLVLVTSRFIGAFIPRRGRWDLLRSIANRRGRRASRAIPRVVLGP
ncbi:MAG: Rieske 2Fe-2S domain-containing protein [Gemmatimonadota bacterium]